MNQRTVNSFSEESRMEGDLFLPSDLKANERRPGVVLCHGFTGVRSLILGDYAKIFAEAGFVALTFDYRGYGGSEGIRRRLIAMEQIDDIRNAISFFETLPEVDPERVGLWGTSFGGVNAPYTAAVDTRIKAVVGSSWLRRRSGASAGMNILLGEGNALPELRVGKSSGRKILHSVRYSLPAPMPKVRLRERARCQILRAVHSGAISGLASAGLRAAAVSRRSSCETGRQVPSDLPRRAHAPSDSSASAVRLRADERG